MTDKIIITSDGSHTLHVPGMNEHFHSTGGAVRESMLVFITNGFDHSKAENLKILEVGFGTGLNALLTFSRSVETGRPVNYTSIEKYPLDRDTLEELNHYSYAGTNGKQYAGLIYSAQWNTETRLNENFVLNKVNDDFLSCQLTGGFNLIYFDAFGPDKQPEMWSQELFDKIAKATVKGGILVTYSVKGTVKRALKASGFSVELLKGPPGKRQVLRAVKLL